MRYGPWEVEYISEATDLQIYTEGQMLGLFSMSIGYRFAHSELGPGEIAARIISPTYKDECRHEIVLRFDNGQIRRLKCIERVTPNVAANG